MSVACALMPDVAQGSRRAPEMTSTLFRATVRLDGNFSRLHFFLSFGGIEII